MIQMVCFALALQFNGILGICDLTEACSPALEDF
jgi:hypothetical protein